MSEPWNQWYPHDIDTWQGSGNIQALSDTGYRAVHNIMQDMWKQEDCSLPCDQKVLRKASRVADRWENCKEEVMDYFDRMESGAITNNVLRGKWMKAKVVYESRQKAAKKTNKTKTNHGKPSKASRSAKQSETIASRSADTLTVTDTSTTTKAKTITPANAVELPEWIDREVWEGFMEVRRNKRAKPTERAIKGILKQLGIFRNKGHDPNAVLETSIRANYTDVYEPKAGATNGKSDGYSKFVESVRNRQGAAPVGPSPGS